MRSDALLRNACLLISIACLTAGYLLGGYWLILPLMLAMAGFLFALRRQSPFLQSSALLVGYVALAAIGIELRVSMALLIPGVSAALAAWDLAYLAETIEMAADPESIARLRRAHLQPLLIAVGGGMVLASLATIVRLDLPFGLVGALALLLVASLTRLGPQIRDTARTHPR